MNLKNDSEKEDEGERWKYKQETCFFLSRSSVSYSEADLMPS